jgi:hypothetical protein
MSLDRDALKQRSEDARYRAEALLGAVEPEQRKLFLRLSVLGGALLVLLAVGAIFFWRAGPTRRTVRPTRQISAQRQSLAEQIRQLCAERPEFAGVTIHAVGSAGDSEEYLLAYGSVPTADAMEQLRQVVEEAATATRVEWRVGVVPPDGRTAPAPGG